MNQRYFLFLLSFLSFSLLAAGPVAICEAYVNVALPNDACTVNIHPDYINAGSYDPAGTDYLATWVTGGVNLAPGTHTVILNVWSNGATNTCWSSVTVEDKTDPTITCNPQTIYLVAPDAPFTVNADDLLTSSDNCSIASMELNVTDYERTSFGLEYYTASATDAAGNTSYCWGTITTVDAESQNYCSSDRNDYYEHIANLTLTTSSGTANHSSGADGGYNWHYPNGNTLYHGFSYNLSYTPGFRFSTTYQEYWRVYIDKNADGDFTDSGELLHQWQGYGGNSFTFTSPGTVWGWSRLRVVMSYGGYAGPCGNNGYGETEDISVYLRPYFFLPWPGFRQAGEEITNRAMLEHEQRLPLTENRPLEAQLAGEAAQRPGPVATSEMPTTAHPITETIALYPNPVRAGQPLTITGQDPDDRLQLFNLNGQVIQTFAGNTSELIIPEHVPAGIYLLRGKDWTRRVVVL